MEALRTLVGSYQQREGIEIAYKAFGRSEMGIVEVPQEHLLKAALWLRSDESLRFDWVELMSTYERKGKLHVSYFVRSQSRGESCVLRTSAEPADAREWVQLPSLTGLWPMIRPYEEEASSLFGIRFASGSGESPAPAPADFPLRKSFEWKGGRAP